MPIPLDTIEEYINEIQNNTTVLPVSKTIKDNSPRYDLKIIL